MLAVAGQSDGQWLIDRLMTCGVETTGIRLHQAEPTGLTVAISTCAPDE
jgi:sugar/nucleoside kinase (ribokinase family)